MTKIYLENLLEMNEEEVYQLLVPCEPKIYAIVIPKPHDRYFGGVAGIYEDYQVARYLRLCLSRISRITGFTIPPICEMGEFTLVSFTQEVRQLAGILSFIASGYDECGRPTQAFVQALPELIQEEMTLRPYHAYHYDMICEALDANLSFETVEMLEAQYAEEEV